MCEMKFTESPFAIDKKYGKELRQKARVFRERSASNKVLFLTMITANGIKENQYSTELVSNEIHLAQLFVDSGSKT